MNIKKYQELQIKILYKLFINVSLTVRDRKSKESALALFH